MSHSVQVFGLTHYQTTDFWLVQIETVCRQQFLFDENTRKFSKRVENTVVKGEIAHYEQFLLFPQCFQKACFPGESQGVIVWEWVKCCYWILFLVFQNFLLPDIICNPWSHKPNLKQLWERSLWKHWEKGRQEGHDGPEIAHLSLLTKHAPSSFPVT